MSYNSVKNTAKNGLLVRAEVREIVLALALYYGFEHDKEKAMALYPNNPHRQDQFTSMKVTIKNDLPTSDNIANLSEEYAEVLKYYFKHKNLYNDCYVKYNTEFYDTKKFRIYAQRLEYGKDKLIRLTDNTMQYFWTKRPAALWLKLANSPADKALDFKDFYCIRKAADKIKNMHALSKYFSKVCYLNNSYIPERSITKLYFDEEGEHDYENLLDTLAFESVDIKSKLYNNGYIENLSESDLKSMRKKGWLYDKETREKNRRIISIGKANKNKTTD